MFDCGAKAELLGEHDELDDIAPNAASETKPRLGSVEYVEVWPTTVGVKRTPSDECMSLSPELDAVASHNIFNRVRQLESGGVDPPDGRCDGSSLYCHSG